MASPQPVLSDPPGQDEIRNGPGGQAATNEKGATAGGRRPSPVRQTAIAGGAVTLSQSKLPKC